MRQQTTADLQPKEKEVRTSDVHSHWTALKILEQTIGQEKVQLFENFMSSGDLKCGSTSDQTLFTAWKKIKEVVFPPDLYCPNPAENLETSEPVISNTTYQHDQLSLTPTQKDLSPPPTHSSLTANIAGPSTSSLPFEVPSPFKNASFFPDRVEQARKDAKKKKIQFPDVITSEKWQEFHQKKAQQKAELEELKKKRAEERLRKKQEKEELEQEKKSKRKKENVTKSKKLKEKGDKTHGGQKKKSKRPIKSSSEEDWEFPPNSEANDSSGSEGDDSESHACRVLPCLLDVPENVGDEELEKACDTLLARVHLLQSQVEVDNVHNIEDNDFVLTTGDKVYKVTSLADGSFIGIPAVQKPDKTYVLKNNEPTLLFLNDVCKKL